MSRREEVEGLNAEITKALNAKDIPAYVAFYEEGVLFLPPYAPVMSGRDVLEARHTAFIETVEAQEFEFDIIDVIDGGDFVVELAHISSTIHFRNGNTDSGKIKHMVIWREQADGTLKIAAEAVNRDAP